MESCTSTKVFEKDSFPNIEENIELYKYYIQQCEELKEQKIEAIELEDFISYIINSNNFEIFKVSLDNIKKEFLYTSVTHGILHNERVALFSYYLSSKLQLSVRDIQLSLYSAMYHDIGRSNDFEDKYHGMESANKLELLNLDLDAEELNILKTIITCHSLPDEMFETIAIENNIQDFNRTKTLFKILKDADGLDRVRLEYPYVRTDLLRNELSLQMIPLAYKLIKVYLEIQKQKD